ncbi:Stigma-specific protein [Parasponia andersonii]|uniref:Stigma-specific protein n=1 Tax=Parasponia andersonii TaxID=3476 RepID=A0A2P5BTJ7_PARAD|nr:Stigma-specific protein [Parasponia andersonii]
MKLLVLVLFFTLAISNVGATYPDHDHDKTTISYDAKDDHDLFDSTMMSETSLGGMSRFLAQQSLTCEKFPRVCRLKRSIGLDCCKKKCVNVKTDRLNCGMCGYKCGYKCKYTEICCKGKCVNSSFDRRHCVTTEEICAAYENEISNLLEDNISHGTRSSKSVKAGEKAPEEVIKLWKDNGFSSLIVAAPDQDTWSLVKELLPLLSNSVPFAIYHQFLQFGISAKCSLLQPACIIYSLGKWQLACKFRNLGYENIRSFHQEPILACR